MKKILFSIALLITAMAGAQTYKLDTATYGIYENRIKVKNALGMPKKNLQLNTNDTSAQIFITPTSKPYVYSGGVSGSFLPFVMNAQADTFYLGAAFNNTTRVLTLTRQSGLTTSVVIPSGASTTTGITSVTNTRSGNILTQSFDNGFTAQFDVRDADSATIMHTTDTAAMLSGYPLSNGRRATGTWSIDITGNAVRWAGFGFNAPLVGTVQRVVVQGTDGSNFNTANSTQLSAFLNLSGKLNNSDTAAMLAPWENWYQTGADTIHSYRRFVSIGWGNWNTFPGAPGYAEQPSALSVGTQGTNGYTFKLTNYDTANTGGGPSVHLASANGYHNAPTQLKSGQNMGSVGWYAYGDTRFTGSLIALEPRLTTDAHDSTGGSELGVETNSKTNNYFNGRSWKYSFTDSGYFYSPIGFKQGSFTSGISKYLSDGRLGQAVVGTDYQLPVSAGTGISIASNIITNTGVTSIVAGSNITISGATGAVTINAVSNGGTITSVAVTGTNGIGVSGSPISSSGTFILSLGDITPTSVSTSGNLTVSGNALVNKLEVDGVATFSPTGITNPVKIGTGSTYGMLSLNGSLSTSGLLGLFGGASGDDKTQYYQVPVSANHKFRVSTSTVATIDANGFSTTGILTASANTYSSGGYDVILRNQTTGTFEKINNGFINNSTSLQSSSNFNISGIGKAAVFVGANGNNNGVDAIQSGGGSILSNLYRMEGKIQSSSTTIDATASVWQDNSNGSTTYTLPNNSNLQGGLYMFIKTGTGTLTLSGTIVNKTGGSVGSVALTSTDGLQQVWYNGTIWRQVN